MRFMQRTRLVIEHVLKRIVHVLHLAGIVCHDHGLVASVHLGCTKAFEWNTQSLGGTQREKVPIQFYSILFPFM